MADKEYIEREALLENLRELHKAEIRLYNRSKSDTERRETISGCVAVAECIVQAKEAPTADVVEVVRCKDCKHRYVPTRCALWYATVDDTEYFVERGDDFYCSYGEAKMDGKGEG